MMLVTRLVLLVAALVLLGHGHCAKTPVAVQQEVVSPNTTANERHRIDKDETSGDHRQGRMALHTEAPSSKVKREQALRNILAARRRQLVGPKVSEAPKNWRLTSRTARPAIGVSKDPLDILEAQETRHGVYVTAPIGDQIAIVVDTDDEDIVEFDEGTRTTPSSTSSSLEVIEKSAESVDRSSRNSPLRVNDPNEKNPKNASQLLSRVQKNSDSETRRKNTVAMPESVYNHFRPVESNIPVEDMTQFLYFGQKIQPESHNSSTTANNSIVDATATSSPIARRRYSTKRFGTTTTPIPMPRLEEMINEEMNIALERGTIERNKIPKTKNVFRSPGSGAYFRKSTTKATDQTIVSNVIPTRESARNASAESEVAAAAAAAARPSDSSANANQIDQVAVPVDRGIGSVARSADNALAHRERNTTSLDGETEIAEEEVTNDDRQENLTGKTNDNRQENTTDKTNDNRQENSSDKMNENRQQNSSGKSNENRQQISFGKSNENRQQNLTGKTNENRQQNSTGKSNENRQQNSIGKSINDRSRTTKPIDAVSESSIGAESSTVQFVFTTDYESSDEKSNRITTWQFVHTPEEASTSSSSPTIVTDDPALTVRTIDNLAETTTIPSDPTTASLAHSSLRIVVTEPMGYEPRFESATQRWESSEADEVGRTVRPKAESTADAASPVNQADWRVDQTGSKIGENRTNDHRHLPTGLPSTPTPPTIPNTTSPSPSPHTSNSPNNQSSPQSLSSDPTEHRQQHAYAYEITNVTRLLRNYTGPGLNAVTDRRGKEDGRKKESVDQSSTSEKGKSKLEEEDEEEEKRKNAGKKKQRKPSDERDEEGAERGTSSSSSSNISSSSLEERGSALTRTGSSVQKIRNDGGSPTAQHQSLPLLPTLQRPNVSSSSSSSGGTVEPSARTPGALSAGTDVDGAAARTVGSWNAIASTGSAPIIRSSGGNSGARGSRLNDSSSGSNGSQSPSASSSSSSSSASSSSSSSSSTSTLVGERGRKGAHAARQQYHQQNQNRGIAAGGRASALSAGSSGSGSSSSFSSVGIGGSSGVGTRNTQPTGSATFASVEVDGSVRIDDRGIIETKKRVTDEVTENTLVSSTVRWNHTGVKRLGGDRIEGYGYDRRYLRKSVSAVLNQRPIDEVLVKELKRRRESTLQAGGTVETASSGLFGSHNGRRKGYSRSGVEQDGRTSILRPMDGGTVTLSSRSGETSQSSGGREDAISEEPKKSDGMSEVRERMTEEPTKVTDGSVNVGREIDEQLRSEVVTEVATESSIETTVDVSGVQTSTDMDGDERANLTDEVTSRDLGGISETVVNGAKDDSGDSTTTSVTLSDDLTSVGSTEAPETTTTTSAAPAFPVTPRMLRDPDEAPKTSNSEDQEKRVDTPEASRPFGLAKDLEPSEIQKMYRSQTTMRSEAPMTTILPETSTEANPENTMAKGKGHSVATMSPVNSSVTRKPIGGERSPEVRGRNLSDKIEDKDDVLPIMGLYNTSGIFNGTARDSQEAVTLLPGAIEVTETTTRQQIQQQPSDSEPAATLAPDASESSTTPRRPDETTEVKRQRNSDTEPSGTVPTKRHRNGSGRDDSTTNHTNSHNFYNASGANRTRHRPTYHNSQSSPSSTSPPEFIGYRPEFNGSFFEPGMISVSSRESVNVSEVITKRHDGDTVATQETVAVVSYILATLIVFPIAVGVGLILRRLIIRNRKVLEESDTSSEISCRKDALNLENGDFKTSIEKAITKLPRIQHLCHEAEKPPPPPSQESRWEFPRDKLRLQTVLGQGNFGQVWKAEADDLTGHQGTTRLVAVKTVKEGASAREKEDLIRELEIMQQLGNHSNVVTLLGCCTEEEPHYLILEYVMYGKLLAYLRDHRTRQDFYNFSEDSAALTSRDLTVFGYCVARGMEYLASKKIIHRDLAARNVLVDHNKLCKIADFGMSRFSNDDGEVIEARHGRNALPIRWMAPESLIYSLFTTKTDVWSFGILMWEIVTLGSTPYPDMAAREVMRNVQNGYRLERPSHCRSELFRVIARCWHADPDRRPEFQVLRRDMAQLLEDSMNGHYVDLESFASECTD